MPHAAGFGTAGEDGARQAMTSCSPRIVTAAERPTDAVVHPALWATSLSGANLGSGSKSTRRVNARGARSRAAILAQATALASVYGLDGLTLGRLAIDLGISKGNIVTLFGSKQQLQLAVLDAAVAD